MTDPVSAAEQLIEDAHRAAAHELQMLTAGALIGIMIREMEAQGLVLIDIEPVVNEAGNYEPWFFIEGQKSHTRLKISVEDVTEHATG